MPQYAIAQPGSAAAIAVNSFSASGYQNECSVQVACLNACCDGGAQEIAKSTSSVMGAVSARKPWYGNASSAAAAKPVEIR
ncbi:hypothetical protein JQ615_41650 [Bradyrhizobium jicamae]|uniref:Uncharacterized protein n=1 Tax=Bradyrhizobium jicamae TaxID=280332 RepID=A0ABS5FYD7_9BRAD|nr:hypothetical protein [Bradyrhizobium jicamae]MBR0801839.1 hypothetical protein [Bradyrhizobium jicamae]